MQQFGATVLPISTVVDNLLAEQGNMARSHYMKNMVHAKWAWKGLLRMSVFSVFHKIVDVENGRIIMPPGIERVIAVSTVDGANNIRPLDYNPYINTLDLTAPAARCSCRCKGQDTLCAMMDNIVYRTEPIETVAGQVKYKKIWNRIDPCGALYEVTLTPVYDTDVDTIIYIESEKLVCPVEVTDDGCVKKTPENERAIREHCGCFMMDIFNTSCDRPASSSRRRGQWNFEANSGNAIDLRHVSASRLILTCKTNGDCDDSEIMVPEFAADALMFGIQHRQAALAPTNVVRAQDKEYAYRQYKRAKTEMLKYLFPINMEEFSLLSSVTPKW